MKDKLLVSTQGINNEFTSANGSYDELSRGEKDNFELYELFQKCTSLQFPEIKEDEDFCYPNILVTTADGSTISFSVEDKKIILSETGTALSPKDAVKFAFGELKINKREKLKESRDNLGKVPALKPEIPPTDRDNVQLHSIDTSYSSPQITLKVWKSSGWKEFAHYFPITVGIFLLFIGLIVLGEGREGEAEVAPLLMFFGLLIFLLIFPLRKLGKHEFKLGFDWKTNTLWCWRSNKGIVGFECDANMIKTFSFVDATSRSFNYRWYSDQSQSMYRVKKSWQLQVLRTTSEHWFGVKGGSLATKKEATEVAMMANQLLQSQK
jgi:hypothetical protein